MQMSLNIDRCTPSMRSHPTHPNSNGIRQTVELAALPSSFGMELGFLALVKPFPSETTHYSLPSTVTAKHTKQEKR